MPIATHPEDLTVDRDLRLRFPQLPTPMILRWSDLAVVAAPGGRPWLYGPIERDPYATTDGYAVPRPELARLARFAAMKIPFQRLGFAHELDPEGPVAALLPELGAGPRMCTDEVARLLVGPQPVHPAVRTTLRALEAVCELRRLPAAAQGLARALDPIVFGVIGSPVPTHGELAVWYPLAAWRW